ncbi:LysR substrate-binding domain-containing protein [Ruegeria arenilitoris]|uniref:LysR substrate-binding domain-containing protein n=1 Tax=Ruegeria arenilitoris TaxID=1173585 RepID=UPI00147B3D8C|nr:LysR substrate-binding domain-containing protein [Ruegeria arenilitoris]
MPALNWKLLMAFEAVARHRNFTHAASELNVQQPSISRRVAELEAELGVKLLVRTRPTAALTAEGDLLFHAISGGVAQVSDAINQIKAQSDRNVVVVNTTIGFASCYLMQHLASFRMEHPDIAVELVSRDQNDAYRSAHADVLILFDEPKNLPSTQAKRIFSEKLIPVGSPNVFQPVGDALEDLAQLELLHLSTGVHSHDWERYFRGTDISLPVPKSEQRFTSFMVYLQAALNGDGVILGWETLFQNLLDQGQLVRLTPRTVETDRGYFVCLTARAENSPAATTLWKWVSSLAS